MTYPESNEEGQSVSTPESPEQEVYTSEASEAGDNLDYTIGDAASYDTAETEAPADEFAVEAPIVSDRPVQTVGRRKEAVVRVRLVPGSGQFTLNGKSLEVYFPNKLHQQLIKEPLVTVEKTERFDIFANLTGGGTSGQAGALRLAIARALVEVDSEDRPPLKKAGFLTRDARATERKKYGLKKARKAPQYSKR
ncbi:30S ribosomal protein S9 [Pseudonocardia halophobica]|uniref:Small ribosomal subunit protein uS9 n=1 Tax=Pseudonocardia halophobica TaxID=29401 RepID=A0A9W6NW84_9PSEU|nr:30S ribosomal protein S9 [Pseudonocardia halophobica]GLL11368.1 30S ribosomal protein S9 [Pseudonocardia halophobica]